MNETLYNPAVTKHTAGEQYMMATVMITISNN